MNTFLIEVNTGNKLIHLTSSFKEYLYFVLFMLLFIITKGTSGRNLIKYLSKQNLLTTPPSIYNRSRQADCERHLQFNGLQSETATRQPINHRQLQIEMSYYFHKRFNSKINYIFPLSVPLFTDVWKPHSQRYLKNH